MPTRLLTLVRHAKASAEHRGGQRDFARPLAPRGERDVVRMGERLARAGVRPDRIVVSTARRAQQTADAIARALGLPVEGIDRSEAVYMATHRALVELIESTSPDVGHLMLVGHNPGLSRLWGWLTGDDGAELPTCGVARLELDVDGWPDVYAGCARLVEHDYPKREPER